MRIGEFQPSYGADKSTLTFLYIKRVPADGISDVMLTKMWMAGFISALLISNSAYSQSQTSQLTFEVAAIHPASFPTPQTIQSGQFRTGARINGNSLDFEFVTLADLIPYAYRVKSFQVVGPDWMRQLRWNILARLPDASSKDQAPEMMLALLADRFKLAVHREKRQQPVYQLVVAKGGAKLVPADSVATEDSDNTAVDLGPGGFFPPRPIPGTGAPPADGGARGNRPAFAAGGARISPGSDCGMHIEFDQLTMQTLADNLTRFLDRPVVDGTAMKGSYKVTMDLPIDAMFAMMQNVQRTIGLPPPGQGQGPGFPGGRGFPQGGGPRGGPQAGCRDAVANAASGGDTSNTAIFQAVQKMGLQLQPIKAPFDTVVVDHLEKTPTEN